MPYLTVVRMQGDPDELLPVKRDRFDPVALRVGAANGMISTSAPGPTRASWR